MTRKVLLRSPAMRRKAQMKDEKEDLPRERRRFAEILGGSAAECTAVCCCCPLTVLNLVIFAMYKAPAGLCRKAMNKRKRRRILKRKSLIQQTNPAGPTFVVGGAVGLTRDGFEGNEKMGRDVAANGNDVGRGTSKETADLIELEQEMWGRFSQTGFWRSPSQRQA